MTDWTKAHAELSLLFVADARYPGYKPDVREAPGGGTKECLDCGSGRRGVLPDGPCPACRGTGRVLDLDAGPAGKRYLHVADKYNPPAWARTWQDIAFAEACRRATLLKVPAAYYPRAEYGALRVLEYPSAGHAWASFVHGQCRNCGAEYAEEIESSVCPALAPGAGTAEHADVSLFTLNLWRSTPNDHEQLGTTWGPDHWECGAPPYHIGRIGELVGLGPAVRHRVPARPYKQAALVYFAIPDHAAVLPGGGEPLAFGPHGPTVGEWLEREMAAMRYSEGR